MPTLKLGSTPVLTEALGALTINVANPTVTLGSNTTFGSDVSLSNATFPAGHVIKYYSQTRSSGGASLNHSITQSWTKISFGGNFDITGVTATENNKLRIIMANMNWHANDDNTYATSLAITTDGTTVALANVLGHWSGYMNDAGSRHLPLTFVWEYIVPSGFANKTLSVVTRKQTGAPSGDWWWNTTQNANASPAQPSTVVFSVEEIQV